MSTILPSKVCIECGERKVWPDEFHKAGKKRNGKQRYRGDCDECRTKLLKARRTARGHLQKNKIKPLQEENMLLKQQNSELKKLVSA